MIHNEENLNQNDGSVYINVTVYMKNDFYSHHASQPDSTELFRNPSKSQ